MSLFASLTIALAGMASAAAAAPAAPAPVNSCSTLQWLANSSADAAPALQDCLDRLPSAAILSLRPGTYLLRRSIKISKPVSITTLGIAASAPACGGGNSGRCAELTINLRQPAPGSGMPLLVTGADVTLSHLIIQGVGNAALQRTWCGRPDSRPSSGGIRVSASGFNLRKSLVRHFTCYTALEITAGSLAPVIDSNVVGANGDHRPGEIWSDGVTIHDSRSALVRGNLFIDNTDVQLIFGGCRDCRVENNRFRHGGAHQSASFAELMLHSWPNTSGDFTGTIVRGNDLDCGPERRCGYGMMVGAAPWYVGRMAGGTITGNRVRNAMVGINIDGVTGPVTMIGNIVAAAGGRYQSDCGVRDWPAANISPGARRYVRGDPSDQAEGTLRTDRCILNR